MENREMVNKLRDMAELAQASYGYFDLAENNDFFIKVKDEAIESGSSNKPIALHDILDLTYKDYKVYQYDSFLEKDIKVGTLDGDFSPLQVKQFFERYELIYHIPNTSISGFSATLFEDKGEITDKATNTRKKVN